VIRLMSVDPSGERSGNKTRTRARRYPVEGVVRYRERANEGTAWQRGSLVNVSQSGVLFWTDKTLVPGATLDLTLELGSPLHATAVIARSAAAEHGCLVGAKFDALSFFEPGDPRSPVR
jgi:hypothetical protein